MYTPIQRYAIIALSVIILGIIGAYIFLQARNYLSGPGIAITVPENGAIYQDATIHVSGTATSIAEISLNGQRIYTDESGIFDERIVLAAGLNIITLDAKDKFNRTVMKTLEVVYKE
ncbi:MAG: hypothetical protein COW88_00245 [Candidatus Lloydbacteria bacterium CG22_combo_CG10-13_8_21_14_all_47_15]|uniref:Uncharacterized protein n=1 Tax=Candidatus Lloydbacteria bacterium CG22_combo_CG10-13_8_21_14_all_47_15 TaxID=1974635 RepID=A0A2H0CVQ9_9BACT|nr:MAG: hypothetical protein COW88_00245 [Candidatus Lloydbacteria bacterium CG22_combo_CG10-13_8_21_14_all_47_15]